MHARVLSALAAFALLASAAAAQEFQTGDLYLLSHALPTPTGTSPGVMRIDALDGTAHLVFTATSIGSGGAFDPFRGGIVMGVIAPGTFASGEMVVLKADGSFTKLGVSSTNTRGFASAGDGRVYFRSGTSAVRYLDAANAPHDLLDASGAAPFTFLNGTATATQMHFHAATNALFLGTVGVGSACGTASDRPWIFRVPLSADGTKVAGAVQGAPLCVNGSTSGPHFEEIGDGPGGSLFALIDDNTNNAVTRMMTVDPATLATSVYATNGVYLGAAATNAGAYSRLLGRAVILDTLADKLRVFAKGETGDGVPWITSALSSAGASGEEAHMLEIPDSAATGLAPYGAGTPGCAGAHALFGTVTPAVGAAGFRFHCTNAPPSALGLLVVGNAPWNPGVDVLGLGFLLHVDLFTSTLLDGLDLTSDAFGVGKTAAPIPILPSYVGLTIDAQAIWAWTGCATPSPFGISASNGLAVTFQP